MAVLVLTGCGVKKGAVSTQPPAVIEPTWHTCLIQGAKASVTIDDEHYNATVTMQTVHDSLLIISIMPAMGIELARLEATPTEMTAIDKLHGRYAVATYSELNRKLTPHISWAILQQIASGELPTGDETARLRYSFDGITLAADIHYTPRKTDLPLRMTRLRLTKYTKIDISNWL